MRNALVMAVLFGAVYGAVVLAACIALALQTPITVASALA